MMRTKGEAGTGNIIEAVRHLREISRGIAELATMSDERLAEKAEEYRVPLALLKTVRETGHLPVPNFAAGGVATPADAALCRILGAESVFVGSGIFKSGNPLEFAKAVVQATCFYNEPKKLLEVSRGLGQAMRGIEIATIPTEAKLANRGW
jgi:pyridoxal 5'-phosphate synthase pdxS subunit